MADKRSKRLSAKDFFSGLNDEEKSDNTRVAKATPKYEPTDTGLTDKANDAGHLSDDYSRRVAQRQRKDMMDIQSNARYRNADENWDKSKEQRDSIDIEDGARHWNSGRDSYGLGFDDVHRKQMSTDEYADQVERQSKKFKDNVSAEVNRRQAQSYKKLRSQERQRKASEFERNMTRFDKHDSRKNPGGWAKEFFKDVHDKEVK